MESKNMPNVRLCRSVNQSGKLMQVETNAPEETAVKIGIRLRENAGHFVTKLEPVGRGIKV
jgi:hypothetical protein